ncbi:hypothetical protein LSTR_LSTR014787 [Laodelphax striatellus]|uniref:Uncharacterized protein n=1 Tax=Laodelphax striatellus TaxID=195883 RepID=A0A482WW33_LAOST|nr:hypothetical protein LSTR_LSTR014787 [Laodelphax striatellus]
MFRLLLNNPLCSVLKVQDQGVDPNLADGDGASPLHFAASRGHLDCVRWLLRHGAKLSLDKFGKSPINDAAENQQMECSYADCVNYTAGREPFYLHLPSSTINSSSSTTSMLKKDQPHGLLHQDGLYINPLVSHQPTHQLTSAGGDYLTPIQRRASNDPFFLHDPADTGPYHRVKDLFGANGTLPLHHAKTGNAASCNNMMTSLSMSSSSSTSSSPPPPPPPPLPNTLTGLTGG